MLHNVNAGIRSRLAVCTIVIMVIFVSLVSAACSDTENNSAAANGRPQTLREVLSEEQLSMVALLDSETPLPNTAGKTILFVDGDFYAVADSTVVDYVREQVEAGVPIALFGGQTRYEALCLSVGTAYSLPDGPQSVEIGVRGLKFYPGQESHSDQIEVPGTRDNLAPLIEAMIKWVKCLEQ
jgi:hypothetical protein